MLSDPERRAAYDAAHAQQREGRWQIFDQEAAGTTPESDQRVRLGILSVLYQSRRRDVDRPGVGILELERILDCPQDHMRFHLWYMKEKGWLERRDNGTLAITVSGLDHLNSQEIPWARPSHRLQAVHGTGTTG